jgi:hypothetical protein
VVDAPTLADGEPSWSVESKLKSQGWALEYQADANDFLTRQLWRHPQGLLALANFRRGPLDWVDPSNGMATRFVDALGLDDFEWELQANLGAALDCSDWESKENDSRMGGKCFWSPEGTRLCAWAGAMVHASRWGAILGRMLERGRVLGFDEWDESKSNILGKRPWMWGGGGRDVEQRERQIKEAWLEGREASQVALWARAMDPRDAFELALKSTPRRHLVWMCEQTVSAGKDEINEPAWPAPEDALLYRTWSRWLADGVLASEEGLRVGVDGAGGTALHALALSPEAPARVQMRRALLDLSDDDLGFLASRVDAAGFTPLGRCFEAVVGGFMGSSSASLDLAKELTSRLGQGAVALAPGGAIEMALERPALRYVLGREELKRALEALLSACEKGGATVPCGPSGPEALVGRLRAEGFDQAASWTERVLLAGISGQEARATRAPRL